MINDLTFPHAANCTFSVSECTCHVKRFEELEEQLKAAHESLFTVEDLYRMATARCEAAEVQLFKISANSSERMIQ